MIESRVTNAAERHLPPVEAAPLDWELLVCTHVLGLTSLHWGLWGPHDRPSLDGLREAQDRYTDLVLDTLPDDAQDVLDVGCGTGDLARRLAGTGRRVKAIAPIANYEHRLTNGNGSNLVWQQARLQDLTGDGPFDAVMMIESAGYFPIGDGLERARDLLEPGGWLLVVNPFRTANVDVQVAKHVLTDYLDAARDHGFSLVHKRDITEGVLPTLTLARQFRRNHVEPAVSLLRFAASRSRAVRLGMGIGSYLFRRPLAALRRKVDVFTEQMDPDLFRKHARYMVLLFRKEA